MKSQVVDLGFAQDFQEKVSEKAQHRIQDSGQPFGSEDPVVDPIERTRRAAHQRQRMDGVRAVVQDVFDLEHHSLIDVKTLQSDLVHDSTDVTRVDQPQRADRLANANHAAVRVAEGALLVVNQKNLARSHGLPVIQCAM